MCVRVCLWLVCVCVSVVWVCFLVHLLPHDNFLRWYPRHTKGQLIMIQHNYLQSGWLIYGVNAMSTIRSIQTYYESYHFSYHYRPQRSCGKVMFLHLSVCHSVHRGRHAWGGGVRGGGHAWQRGAPDRGHACGEGGGGGRSAWQERRPLQRVVRILVECILVSNRVFRSFHKNDRCDISANVVHMDQCFNIKLCYNSVICWRFDSWYLWTTLKNNSKLHKR